LKSPHLDSTSDNTLSKPSVTKVVAVESEYASLEIPVWLIPLVDKFIVPLVWVPVYC